MDLLKGNTGQKLKFPSRGRPSVTNLSSFEFGPERNNQSQTLHRLRRPCFTSTCMAREEATLGVDHVTYIFIGEGVGGERFYKNINPASIVLPKIKCAHSHCRKKKKIRTRSVTRKRRLHGAKTYMFREKKFRVNERA